MKFIALSTLLSLIAFGEAPKNFYNKAKGLSGYKLKTALSSITSSNHRDQGYKALYSYYETSDADYHYDGDGTILDIYSENPQGKDSYSYDGYYGRCGAYKGEADCFNREHLFPQSAFAKRSPMRSDFFHVYPTDGYVNNKRGRMAFGEVSRYKWISSNGSKVGKNTTPGFSGNVFEPIDEFKGDIARAMLYFATRYESRVQSFNHSDMLDGSRNKVYRTWFLNVLLKWHKQDPVSETEKIRNEYGYRFQGNRNPFIDHPEYVEAIWN